MRYTTRASDLPSSKIPEGYEPCKPGPQNFCSRRFRGEPASSTWTPYYLSHLSPSKLVATFGDILMDLETFYGYKIEECETFIQKNDKRVLDYEFKYDKPEDFFSCRNPFEPYSDSQNFYNSHPLVERARRSGQSDFSDLPKLISELDYLEMYRLRLMVIQTLRSIKPPKGVEKLEIPEDLLIGEKIRAGIQNVLHGQAPEIYGVLYLNRSSGRNNSRQIYLPNYNALVKSINEDFPKSPKAVYEL